MVGPSLKTRLLLTANSAISYLAHHPHGTVNRRLLNLTNLTTPPSTTPKSGTTTSDHRIPTSPHLWFRLFLPTTTASSTSSATTATTISSSSATTTTNSAAASTTNFAAAAAAQKLPVIIYFHGGGFVRFTPSSEPFDRLCRRIASTCNAIVISIAYRLAPEHKLPTQYDDAITALRFLDEHTDTIPDFPSAADLSTTFIAGDSAGGNIAHHVAVRLSQLDPDSGFKAIKVRGLIAIQPFFGGEERTEAERRLEHLIKKADFYWKAALPEGAGRDHWAANVFEKDVSGFEFPPTLVVIGGLDILRDWDRKYVEWLRKCGKVVEVVEFDNVGHAFYCIDLDSVECGVMLDKIREILLKHSVSNCNGT